MKPGSPRRESVLFRFKPRSHVAALKTPGRGVAGSRRRKRTTVAQTYIIGYGNSGVTARNLRDAGSASRKRAQVTQFRVDRTCWCAPLSRVAAWPRARSRRKVCAREKARRWLACIVALTGYVLAPVPRAPNAFTAATVVFLQFRIRVPGERYTPLGDHPVKRSREFHAAASNESPSIWVIRDCAISLEEKFQNSSNERNVRKYRSYVCAQNAMILRSYNARLSKLSMIFKTDIHWLKLCVLPIRRNVIFLIGFNFRLCLRWEKREKRKRKCPLNLVNVASE